MWISITNDALHTAKSDTRHFAAASGCKTLAISFVDRCARFQHMRTRSITQSCSKDLNNSFRRLPPLQLALEHVRERLHHRGHELAAQVDWTPEMPVETSDRLHDLSLIHI